MVLSVIVEVAMRVRECFLRKNRVPCTGSSRLSSKYIGCKRVECTDRGVKRSWRTHAPNRRTRRRNPLSVTRDPSRLLSSSRAIVIRRRVVTAHRIDFPPPTQRFQTFRKRVSACEKLACFIVASRHHLSGKCFIYARIFPPGCAKTVKNRFSYSLQWIFTSSELREPANIRLAV